MTYQTKLPLGWDTERLTMTGLGVNRIVKVHGDRVCSETTHAQVDMEMVF